MKKAKNKAKVTMSVNGDEQVDVTKHFAGKGHNIAGISGEHLRQYIERIERLEEERKSVLEDIKSTFAEAKANGFDVKIMRKIIAIRKREAAEIEEEETLIGLYKRALGMQSSFDFDEGADA